MSFGDSLTKGLARRILRDTNAHWEKLERQVKHAKKPSRTRWFQRRLESVRALHQDCLIHYSEEADGKYRRGYVIGVLWLPDAQEGISGVFMQTTIDGRHCRSHQTHIALISLHALERAIQTCQGISLPVLTERLRPHLEAIAELHVTEQLPDVGFTLYTRDGMSAWAYDSEDPPILKTLVAREVMEPRHMKYINELQSDLDFCVKLSQF